MSSTSDGHTRAGGGSAVKYFDSDSLTFFRGLKKHNAKPWFEAHRDDYEQHVRGPLTGVVREMDSRFAEFAPEFVGDPKRSMFRLNRDIRFSADKSPYKTHAACWFFHMGGSSKVGREAHGGGAGFYFHLEPGASMLGGGCWMPPRPALQKFRAAIANDRPAFERMVLAPALKKRLGGLSEESMLKRSPRGYEEAHPAAHWLKFQSFTVGRKLTDAEVTGAYLTRTLQDHYVLMLPLVRWLNTTLGLKPAKAR
jgi:uncharacterized protein (TIGR02453 family)